MRWLKAIFRRPRRREQNRVASLRAVRWETRIGNPAFFEYGDIEENKRRAAALRKKAQQKGDG